jgi:hypothetical protein
MDAVGVGMGVEEVGDAGADGRQRLAGASTVTTAPLAGASSKSVAPVGRPSADDGQAGVDAAHCGSGDNCANGANGVNGGANGVNGGNGGNDGNGVHGAEGSETDAVALLVRHVRDTHALAERLRTAPRAPPVSMSSAVQGEVQQSFIQATQQIGTVLGLSLSFTIN